MAFFFRAIQKGPQNGKTPFAAWAIAFVHQSWPLSELVFEHIILNKRLFALIVYNLH